MEIAVTAVASIASAIIAAVATISIKRRPVLMTAEAQAQTAVNDGFAKLSASLLERLDDLEEQNAKLRAILERQHREFTGEISNLSQHVYSLEKILRDEGLPIPIRTRPAILDVVPKAN